MGMEIEQNANKYQNLHEIPKNPIVHGVLTAKTSPNNQLLPAIFSEGM